MSISLVELFDGVISLPPDCNVTITGMTGDSRCVSPGDLFVARAGRQTHGSQFINHALTRGAVAIVIEGQTGTNVYEGSTGIPVITLHNLAYHLGRLAARFYGYPAQRFTALIGVTGTNGKTSITHLLAQVLNRGPTPCALVGTLGMGFPDQLLPTNYTTPDAINLHAIFAQLLQQGACQLVMEVSSHALDQGRVAGINFDVAIFTNLTRDHLDYHGNMETYGLAKQRLFQTPELKYAVINIDDEFGRTLVKNVAHETPVVTYGFSTDGVGENALHIQGTELSLLSTGLRMRVTTPWGTGILESSLLGRFNAANLLAVLSTLGVLGMPLEDALRALARVHPVPGRMETLGGGPTAPLVVVDYAHTPDALEQALLTLCEHITGRLWCVFGCGGERDQGKRPLMGAIAERLADVVVVTNDNPRREDALQISRAILAGMKMPHQAKVIHDRAAAIHYALHSAVPGDVVLIAGKGHENYQQIGEQQLPFNDRLEVKRNLN